MRSKVSALFNSRRFWVAALGVIAVVLEDSAGLSPEASSHIVSLLGMWIIGDSLNKTV